METPGAEVERRKRDGVPLPIGAAFSIFELKKASFGAFWVLESRPTMSK